MNNLIVECTECNKSRIVSAQKKVSTGSVRAFKRVTDDLSCVCELADSKNFKEFHIRQNLKCIDQVEVLYCSAGFTHVAAIKVQIALPSSHVEQMSTLFAVTV